VQFCIEVHFLNDLLFLADQSEFKYGSAESKDWIAAASIGYRFLLVFHFFAEEDKILLQADLIKSSAATEKLERVFVLR